MSAPALAPDPSPAPSGTAPAATGTPAPAPSTSWREEFPSLAAKFKDEGALAKSYAELEKHVGQKGVQIPGKDAKPEEVSAYHRAIGVPETPDQYDLNGFSWPEGLPVNESLVPKMLSHFHAAGVPQEAARKVIEAYAKEQGEAWNEMQQQATRAQQEGVETLKKEWGKAFDERVALAAKAFRSFAGKEYESVAKILLADGTLLGDNPALLRIFASAGQGLGEHRMVGEPSKTMSMTPAEAKAAIAKKEADPEFSVALITRGHPGHDLAVAEMTELQRMANP